MAESNALVQQADRVQQQGTAEAYQQALELLKQALQVNPSNAAAVRLDGEVRTKLSKHGADCPLPADTGKYKQALSLYISGAYQDAYDIVHGPVERSSLAEKQDVRPAAEAEEEVRGGAEHPMIAGPSHRKENPPRGIPPSRLRSRFGQTLYWESPQVFVPQGVAPPAPRRADRCRPRVAGDQAALRHRTGTSSFPSPFHGTASPGLRTPRFFGPFTTRRHARATSRASIR